MNRTSTFLLYILQKVSWLTRYCAIFASVEWRRKIWKLSTLKVGNSWLSRKIANYFTFVVNCKYLATFYHPLMDKHGMVFELAYGVLNVPKRGIYGLKNPLHQIWPSKVKVQHIRNSDRNILFYILVWWKDALFIWKRNTGYPICLTIPVLWIEMGVGLLKGLAVWYKNYKLVRFGPERVRIRLPTWLICKL